MALFDNLIAYYKLDGNCRDSVNIYDGIPNNITFVDGKIGECAQTNGNSQYISLPNEVSVKGRTQVSYSGWCFIESTPNKDFYIVTEIANSSGYTRASFGVNTSLLPFAIARTVATGDTGSVQKVTGTSPMSTGTWYFLCAVFDLSNGNIILYVNGVAVGSLDVTASSFVNANPHRIRLFDFDESGSGSVRVDEVGIWSKALSAAEVSELYNNGAGKTYSPGTSGGTGVVIDGLFLSTSKPTAGDKGLLVNNKFFIPFAESSEGGSGGDTSAFESDAMAIIGTPTEGGGDIEPISQKYMTVTSTDDVGCGVGIEFTGTIQIVEDGVATLYTTSPISNIALRNATVYGDNITYFNCGSTNLASVDPSHNDQLVTLICSNGYLTALDISNNSLLTTLEANSNNLSSAVVDKILSDLVAHGKSNGLLRLENSAGIGAASNGAPTSQNNVTTLQSRGWTVTTA